MKAETPQQVCFVSTGKVPKDLENSFQRSVQNYKEDPKKTRNYYEALDINKAHRKKDCRDAIGSLESAGVE
jgi:hypothetical protein